MFREAGSDDLDAVIRLLAADQLGRSRESVRDDNRDRYQSMFQRITDDPNNELVVVESEGDLIGTLQITWIPYLSYQGSWRCLVESVRVRSDLRSRGIGAAMMNWVIDRARERGCRIVQLTSDLKRDEAHRFYDRLGFVHSHAGYKLHL